METLGEVTPAYEAARAAVAVLSMAERRRLMREMLEPADLLDQGLIAWAREETAGLAVKPTLEDVRRALAPIVGSWAEDVIADRGE